VTDLADNEELPQPSKLTELTVTGEGFYQIITQYQKADTTFLTSEHLTKSAKLANIYIGDQ
jgi:hypothetical protein